MIVELAVMLSLECYITAVVRIFGEKSTFSTNRTANQLGIPDINRPDKKC